MAPVLCADQVAHNPIPEKLRTFPPNYLLDLARQRGFIGDRIEGGFETVHFRPRFPSLPNRRRGVVPRAIFRLCQDHARGIRFTAAAVNPSRPLPL